MSNIVLKFPVYGMETGNFKAYVFDVYWMKQTCKHPDR